MKENATRIFVAVLMGVLLGAHRVDGGLSYWLTDWRLGDQDLNSQIGGTIGLDFGNLETGGTRLDIEYGYYETAQSEDLHRGGLTLRFSHAFYPGILAGFLGYRANVYELQNTYWHGRWQYTDKNLRVLHGPVVGIVGSYSLNHALGLDNVDSIYDVPSPWGISVYYEAMLRPIVLLSGDVDDVDDKQGKGHGFEAGITVKHEHIYIRTGYRQEKVSSLAASDERFSGVMFRLGFGF